MSKAKTASAGAKPDAAGEGGGVVVTTKDATAVVDAATALNAAAGGVSLETVVAKAAEGFEAAAEQRAAEPPVPPIDAAKVAADAAADEAKAATEADEAKVAGDLLNDAPVVLEEVRPPEFPCAAHIFNSGTLGLHERVTGAYLPGGGMAPVELRDAQHALEVAENLRELISLNYLPTGTLSVTWASTPNEEASP